MTPEELEKNLVLLVNTYYAMQEGADMILKEAANILKIQGRILVQKKKQKHNDLMSKIVVIRNLTETLAYDYGDAFGENYVSKTDEVRKAGAFLARLNLKIGDKCGNDDSWNTENQIEEGIDKFPPQGFLHDDLIKQFYIK